jgi:hypothetical protein
MQSGRRLHVNNIVNIILPVRPNLCAVILLVENSARRCPELKLFSVRVRNGPRRARCVGKPDLFSMMLICTIRSVIRAGGTH